MSLVDVGCRRVARSVPGLYRTHDGSGCDLFGVNADGLDRLLTSCVASCRLTCAFLSSGTDGSCSRILAELSVRAGLSWDVTGAGGPFAPDSLRERPGTINRPKQDPIHFIHERWTPLRLMTCTGRPYDPWSDGGRSSVSAVELRG